MTLSQTYGDNPTLELAGNPRTLRGGPRRPRPAATREDLVERFATGAIFGSHMPIDIDAHWSWNNPLNVIPAMILLLVVIVLVAAIV